VAKKSFPNFGYGCAALCSLWLENKKRSPSSVSICVICGQKNTLQNLLSSIRKNSRNSCLKTTRQNLEHFQKYYSRFVKSISHATTQRAQRNPYGAAAPVAVVASLREATVLFKML